MIFDESGRRFTFQRPWIARAYDRHTYFQGLSSAGLKGVDFIALYPGDGYLFMEVKNFRDQVPPVPSILAQELLQKTADTLRGLEAIGSYLHRARHRRLLAPLWRRWPARQVDRAFWTQLCGLHQSRGPQALVFWLEGEQLSTDWRKALLEALPAEAFPAPVHWVHPGQPPPEDVVVVA